MLLEFNMFLLESNGIRLSQLKGSLTNSGLQGLINKYG